MAKAGNDTNFPRGIEVVVSAIIENSTGKILLTQSPKWSNKWLFPGGHIEPGESIDEATVREIAEETGLKLKFITIITWGELINGQDFHRPAHFIYVDVYCKTIGGKLRLDQKELTSYQWIKPKDALKFDLAETYPETIQKFIKYKKFSCK